MIWKAPFTQPGTGNEQVLFLLKTQSLSSADDLAVGDALKRCSTGNRAQRSDAGKRPAQKEKRPLPNPNIAKAPGSASSAVPYGQYKRIFVIGLQLLQGKKQCLGIVLVITHVYGCTAAKGLQD